MSSENLCCVDQEVNCDTTKETENEDKVIKISVKERIRQAEMAMQNSKQTDLKISAIKNKVLSNPTSCENISELKPYSWNNKHQYVKSISVPGYEKPGLKDKNNQTYVEEQSPLNKNRVSFMSKTCFFNSEGEDTSSMSTDYSLSRSSVSENNSDKMSMEKVYFIENTDYNASESSSRNSSKKIHTTSLHGEVFRSTNLEGSDQCIEMHDDSSYKLNQTNNPINKSISKQRDLETKFVSSVSVGLNDFCVSKPEISNECLHITDYENSHITDYENSHITDYENSQSQIIQFDNETLTLRRTKSMADVTKKSLEKSDFMNTSINYIKGIGNRYRVSLQLSSGLPRSVSQEDIVPITGHTNEIAKVGSLPCNEDDINNFKDKLSSNCFNDNTITNKLSFSESQSLNSLNDAFLENNIEKVEKCQPVDSNEYSEKILLNTDHDYNEEENELVSFKKSELNCSVDQAVMEQPGNIFHFTNEKECNDDVIYSVVGVKGRHRSSTIPSDVSDVSDNLTESRVEKMGRRSVKTEKDWLLNLDISKLTVDSTYPTTRQSIAFYRLKYDVAVQPVIISKHEKSSKQKGPPPLQVSDKLNRLSQKSQSFDNDEEIVIHTSAGFVHVVSKTKIKELTGDHLTQSKNDVSTKKKRNFSWNKSNLEKSAEMDNIVFILKKEIHVDMTASFNRKLLYEKVAASANNLTNTDVANLSRIFFALAELENTKIPKRTAVILH